jgi:hypothetical protein
MLYVKPWMQLDEQKIENLNVRYFLTALAIEHNRIASCMYGLVAVTARASSRVNCMMILSQLLIHDDIASKNEVTLFTQRLSRFFFSGHFFIISFICISYIQ